MAFTQREILEEIVDATRLRHPRREAGFHLGLFSVREVNYEAEIHAVESHRVATRAQMTPNLGFWEKIETVAREENFRARERRRLRLLPAPAPIVAAPITATWIAHACAIPNADFWQQIRTDAKKVSPCSTTRGFTKRSA